MEKSNELKPKPKFDINNDPDEPTVLGYVVAFFDVLGFKKLHEDLGTQKLLELYQKLIDDVVVKMSDDLRILSLTQIGDYKYPVAGNVPIRHVYFSDTILLWTPLVDYLVGGFASRCSDMIIEGLKIGIPLRGSITIGGAVMNKKKSIYLGEPIIEAAVLEKLQNWVGVSYGISATHPNFQDSIGHSNVIQYYTEHFKPDSEKYISQMVLDWPRRLRERGDSDKIIKILKNLEEKYFDKDKNKDKSTYYKNTLLFIEYSEQNHDWYKSKK